MLKLLSLAVARKYDTRRIGLSSSSNDCNGFGRSLTGGDSLAAIVDVDNIVFEVMQFDAAQRLKIEEVKKPRRKKNNKH